VAQLLKGEVMWIQEFDARVWEAPADGEPVITAIKFIARLCRKSPKRKYCRVNADSRRGTQPTLEAL